MKYLCLSGSLSIQSENTEEGRMQAKDIERSLAALGQLLQIRTRAQAKQLVDRYIPNKQVQQLNHLDETLDEWFP